MDIVFVSGPELSPDHSRAACVTKRQNYKISTMPAFTFRIAKPGVSRQLTYDGKASDPVREDGHTPHSPAERSEDDKPEKHGKKTVLHRLDVECGGRAVVR
jgi:hypothetical protein